MNDPLIQRTVAFVKETLKNAEGGHDWYHVERVHGIAKKMAEGEGADLGVVELAALLHDIADSKFHGGDESLGPRMARAFLEGEGVAPETIGPVVDIIGTMSFRNSFQGGSHQGKSLEFKIVRDADRLDAMGAIGIARAFSYGGHKNRALYDPDIAYRMDMTKEEYKNSTGATINHFHEKLLLLKDGMYTPTGKRLAAKRHDFMLEFLDRFYKEWQGEE